jgi:uncharacterized protein
VRHKPDTDGKAGEDDVTIPILIVPGLGGSGPDHWQTHLEHAFPGASRVAQDDWNRPLLACWVDRLVAAVEDRPGSLVVAHSLGCPLVAHAAVRRPDLPIAAALLVAPADVDSTEHTPRHIRSFAPIPLRRLPFDAVVVASTNDPYMAFERARSVAAAWGADLVDAGASGHINVASGFGRWPAGEDTIKLMIAAVRGSRFLARKGKFAAAGA